MSKKSLVCLFLFTCCWLTTTYAAHPHASKKTTSANFTVFNLPPFTALDVMGPAKVILTGHQSKQSVTVKLPPVNLAKEIDVAVKDHTLKINTHPQQSTPSPIVIIVHMNHPLKSLTARGSAEIEGKYCGDPHLVVIAKDSARINLQGADMPLFTIQNDSTNAVVVSGVRGKNLILGSSSIRGKIILSGETDELNTRLHGSVLLDARRLKARSAHIQTYDNTAAYVDVTEVLYGFAYDNSNIYYDRYPQRMMRDSHASGNVLKLYY